MKPVTQLLRCFPEPKIPKKKGEREPTERDEQEALLTKKAQTECFGPDAWPWFGPTLIFDTETTTNIGQPLRFGCFQLRGYGYPELIELARSAKAAGSYVSRATMDAIQQTGIFYNPDPNIVIPDEVACLQSYVAAHPHIKLMTVQNFITDIYYKYYPIKSGQILPCMVVGHNLPFDMGAVSIKTGMSRGGKSGSGNYGGLTVFLRPDETQFPGIAIKKVGFGKHLYTANKGIDKSRHHLFIDTLQLTKALFGAGTSGKLSKILDNLGIKDIAKSEADLEGAITTPVIEYCLNDVECTWRAYAGLRALYCKHGVSTPITQIVSEASIGKAYLKDLGVKPFFEKNPDFERIHLGKFMEALYGGRSDMNLRHEIREGIAADFKSEYSFLNAVMNLQELMLANKIDVEVEINDGSMKCPTIEFLENITLTQLQDKNTWPLLSGVALVEPNNDILPARVVYENEGDGSGNQLECAQQIGLNTIVSGPPTWYAFPDVVASKLLTGVCPKILRTSVLKPAGGIQDGLKPINFFGDPQHRLDPTCGDIFKQFIDFRSEIKRKKDPGWKAKEQGIKITSSATAYGALIEFMVDERLKATSTMVYYGLEKAYRTARKPVLADDGEKEISGYKVEKAGKWFAPWGPLIPAGGRLLLAIAEKLALDRGIHHGYCDTDAMFFLRPKNMERAKFQATVKQIAGPTGWFEKLNPFSGSDPVFNIEDVNYAIKRDEQGNIIYNDKGEAEVDQSQLEPLYLLGISAKRYALANCAASSNSNHWIIRKATGHGLGHVSAPLYDKTALASHPAVTTGNEYSICHGYAPKLFCNLWRIVFYTVSIQSDPSFITGYINDAIYSAVHTLGGLGEPQFVQRTMASRHEWLIYKSIPNKRAFMFFIVLSSPVSTAQGVECFDPETYKRRRDLLNTTFYAAGTTKDFSLKNLQAGSIQIFRRDNNQDAVEMFNPDYELRFRTVGDCLHGHFCHEEFKSSGGSGLLQRKRLYIMDHEYIGKETPLVDQAMLDDPDGDVDEAQLPVPIFRRHFNAYLLRNIDPLEMGKITGISLTQIKRLKQGHRLKDPAMARVQASLEIDEYGEPLAIFIERGEF